MPRKSTTSSLKRPVGAKSRKARTVAASERAHWLQSVFEHSSLGIAKLDRVARVVETNEAFEGLLGRTAAELSGHSVREFAAAEDSEAIVSLVAEIGAGKTSSSLREVRFVRPDAKLVWGSIILSRVGSHR